MFESIKRRLKRKKSPEGYEHVSVKEMQFKGGQYTLTAEHPAFVHFTDSIVRYFIDAGGINFVSTGFYHPDTGPIEVVIQRKEGKTPTEKLNDLETKYSEDVNFLTSLLIEHPEGWDGLCMCADCRSILAQDI